MKWREASSVLCDKRIPIRLKGKFYKNVVRPIMVYDLKCWVVDLRIEQSTRIAEIKMLRWMSGVTKEDKIRNEYVMRGSIGIASIVDKMEENRLRWFARVMRQKLGQKWTLKGKRKRKTKKDMVGYYWEWYEAVDVKNWEKWRCRTKVADPK